MISLFQVLERDQIEDLDRSFRSAVLENLMAESISLIPTDKARLLIAEIKADNSDILTGDKSYMLLKVAPIEDLKQMNTEQVYLFSEAIKLEQLELVGGEKLEVLMDGIQTQDLSSLDKLKVHRMSELISDNGLSSLEDSKKAIVLSKINADFIVYGTDGSPTIPSASTKTYAFADTGTIEQQKQPGLVMAEIIKAGGFSVFPAQSD
jgi:hypothetical protein